MRGLNAEVLRTFAAVAETKSFTLAAQRLGLGQSTVSQHIQRLESRVGRAVLTRDTHSVALTPDGDALLDLVRRVLDAHDSIERYASGARLRGRLRLGIAEDFVIAGLHDVLAAFAVQHPSVDLELTVGLSVGVLERFDAGEVDVVFAKRRPGDTRGRVAWRERLVWIGSPGRGRTHLARCMHERQFQRYLRCGSGRARRGRTRGKTDPARSRRTAHLAFPA